MGDVVHVNFTTRVRVGSTLLVWKSGSRRLVVSTNRATVKDIAWGLFFVVALIPILLILAQPLRVATLFPRKDKK